MRKRRTWPSSSIWLLSLLPLIVLAIAGRTSLRSNANWLYFEQIITGNWSSNQPPDINDYVYVFGLIAAVIVSLGPLVAIFGALVIFAKGRSNMDLVNAFASHDLTIEATIVRNLLSDDVIPSQHRDEIVRRVQSSVEEARRDWFGPLLDEIFGPADAERVRARMKEMSIAP